MKAIIQRVTKASVTVGEDQVSSIGRGICVLLGISVDDTQRDAEYMVRKILNLRLFEDENGRAWAKSVMEREFEVLCVSQFTLQCILKGNKPDFHSAMPAELAQPFYNSILESMRSAYKPELIKDGNFGAYMQVNILNDGPVTVELTSPAGPTDPKQHKKTFACLNFLDWQRAKGKFMKLSEELRRKAVVFTQAGKVCREVLKHLCGCPQ
ncbi:D-tyrosyl-tRNA(Tyr) deacylase [Ataeniobius toweri]|uniref:D-aminoacyl-tRNA deacylase n=1 Tax=Ataeniobius toweri TaxID=208326 RepID=A0ABU7BQE2_9TELE|nr:D-tyrosyl-tRNA(Tyr) deacylase [Ataeniobius toweri]